VLEALAAGTPIVVTPVVRNGLPDDIAAGCSSAATAQGFADAIVALLSQTPEARRDRAMRVDLQPLSWEGPRQQFVDVVQAAARR
jgi:glycosyltransferase involved in cell wall biosynthesis